jgi:homoserine O-acetyltransferase/O-succinyltransferase
MSDHPAYTQALHGPYETFDLGNFVLEEGGTLRGCQLAYATFGTLSPARDNAILMPTWFSGTSKIMEQAYIGAGRALDPARHFIIVVNQIGNGLSSSPHNTPSPFGGPSFPRVRIADDVRAQRQLLTEKFGIERLELVVGASMGAEQTYEWAVRFPEAVKRAAPIAGTARTTDHTAAYVDTLVEAITSDPGWAGGWYEAPSAVRDGLRRHARLWAVMGASPAMYAQTLWRGLGFSSVEDFMLGLLDATFLPLDANSLLVQAWKWRHADAGRVTGGDLAQALGRIRAKTFVMPISTDMFFTVADCQAEQRLIPGSEFRVLDTAWGHIGVMGMDPNYMAQADAALRDLLASSA